MITRMTTKEIIGESLHELSVNKPIDKITIKEIVTNCGVSPATFYRYFHDKYELIDWMFNDQIEEIFRIYCSGTQTWQQTMLDMVRILDRDRSFYRNALVNTEGQNSFFQASHQRCLELLTEYVKQKADTAFTSELLFAIKFYMLGASYSISVWCLQDLPYTAEELAGHLCLVMPDSLQPYLL